MHSSEIHQDKSSALKLNSETDKQLRFITCIFTNERVTVMTTMTLLDFSRSIAINRTCSMRSSFSTESVASASACVTVVVVGAAAAVLPLPTVASRALSDGRDSCLASSFARLSSPDGSAKRSLIVCYNSKQWPAAVLHVSQKINFGFKN